MNAIVTTDDGLRSAQYSPCKVVSQGESCIVVEYVSKVWFDPPTSLNLRKKIDQDVIPKKNVRRIHTIR